MCRAIGSLPVRLFVVLSMLGICPSVAGADGPSVVVEIEGLRSNRGEVRGALFHSRSGWTEEGREVATCVAHIAAHRATCVLDDVEPGNYAFAFLHDEDDDGALDRDWIGIPSEGFGFSNDAAPSLGPPSYESARFEHADETTTLHVSARYGL
jgi:uncharacterized protein (DUF2141 family)